MHYYKRNLGDYAKKAGRLSMLQHGSYTLLIDSCYDREQFPTLEDAIEWTWASTTEEVEAVKFVLSKFFTLEGGLYVQKRIQEEISEYHAKSETNKRIANERETKRKENSTKREQVVNETPPNHKPITINHKPIKNNTALILASLGVGETIAADWIALRKTKRAAVTQTAIAGVQREADKAGVSLDAALRICCERGWAGFKAEWVQDQNKNSGGVQDARLKVAHQIWGNQNGNDGSFIDIDASGSIEGYGASVPKALNGIWESTVVEVAGD